MVSKSVLNRFAKADLEPCINFENLRMASAFTRLLIGVCAVTPNTKGVAAAYQVCMGIKPCGLVGCPLCDRYRRIAFVQEVRATFSPLKRGGLYDVFFVTIIPDDGFMPLAGLPEVDWQARRRRYARLLKEALGDDVVTMIGPDIDVRRAKKCCLHLHGIVAIPKEKIRFRRITERLVKAFNPDRVGAQRPVLKKWVKGRYYRLATYIMKVRFAVASKVHKHNGVFLGKREAPIRQFLSTLTPRSRIIRIGTGVTH